MEALLRFAASPKGRKFTPYLLKNSLGTAIIGLLAAVRLLYVHFFDPFWGGGLPNGEMPSMATSITFLVAGGCGVATIFLLLVAAIWSLALKFISQSQ
jgi:hypothetical protein